MQKSAIMIKFIKKKSIFIHLAYINVGKMSSSLVHLTLVTS